MTERHSKPALMGCLLSLACIASAHATYKCVADTMVVYRDVPCDESRGESTASSVQRPLDKEALHRKLDRLQALGVGLFQRDVPRSYEPPKEPPSAAQDTASFVPMTRFAYRLKRDQLDAEQRKKALIANEKARDALIEVVSQSMKSCGDQWTDLPKVGMSDEAFRQCTKQARFGGAIQVVVSQDSQVPLRLYVFPSQQAHKVYSIDGVISAIKP
jgi:hypothetical protein